MLSADILNAVKYIKNVTSSDISSEDLTNIDKKMYISSAEKVGNILFSLDDRFRVLEVGGIRVCTYRTLYFDTRGCLFFNEYINNKPTRHKIRLRHYENLDKSFFEIKVNYSGLKKSVKRRVEIESFDKFITPETESLLKKFTNITFNQLSPILESHYKRVVLIDNNSQQRVSIDMDPVFINLRTNINIGIPELIIIETRQQNNCNDYFKSLVNPEDITDSNFSRYLSGMIITHLDKKYNH